MTIEQIWMKDKQNTANPFSSLLNDLNEIYKSDFIDTLKVQLDKISDKELVIIDKYPFCTMSVQPGEKMVEDVRAYYEDICRSDPQIRTTSVALMEGSHYKEWCRQNVAKLYEWSQTATASNDLLALDLEKGHGEHSEILRKTDELYRLQTNALMTDLREQAATVIQLEESAPASKSALTPSR